MARLQGKVAVVTGAAQGIGKGIADAFREQGAVVIAADLSYETYERSGSLVKARLDVADEQQWVELFQRLQADGLEVSVLVNNAGIATRSGLAEMQRSEWDRVVNTNQLGTYLGIKVAVPTMRSHGGGSIINMSSIIGSRAIPDLAAYHASKAAILGMTRNAAMTYAQDAIRANAILPGWIRTPATESQAEELNRAYLANTPLAKEGTVEDVAWAAIYLASDESSFVTGIELPVDGGYLAH